MMSPRAAAVLERIAALAFLAIPATMAVLLALHG